MDPRIKTILEYAIMAPSGDNCQPWRFNVDGLRVDLFNDPDQDRSLYNLKQRASLIAHGAFLENIRLSAPSVGLQSRIELRLDPDNDDQIATIYFSDGKKEQTDLFKAIPLRYTNREKYQHVKISESQVKQWQALAGITDKKIWLGCQDVQIKRLTNLLSLNDRLVFEVRALHQFLFEQIRWTDDQAKATGDGLDIKTLGLSSVDRLFFYLFKSWTLVSIINKIGFSKIIQMKAKQLLKSSSAVAIITMQGTESVDYIKGGEIWQRLLLQLASEGLHAQPIAGLACLLQSVKEGVLDARLSVRQKSCILKARKELLQMIRADDSDVIMAMFRIGRGRHVARSLRRPLGSFIIA